MLSVGRTALRPPAHLRSLAPLRPLSTLPCAPPPVFISPPRLVSRPRASCRPPSLSPFSHPASLHRRFLSTPSQPPSSPPASPPSNDPPFPSPSPLPEKERRENPYTLPNAITLARIAATPVIGHYILQGELGIATGLLFVAGVSDLVDGWLARRFNMGSVLGSILDPAADKLLMTTLVVTLAMRDMLPLPLAVIILGRDVLLTLSAFYFRYASLPPPKTFSRYWDFSLPSASVQPTQISKYNTFLQLVLVGSTTVAPLFSWDVSGALGALQWIVAGTTIWSGLSYVGAGSGAAVKYLK
ncbi:hypothetical protein JCM8547_009030 [Rhodosporidiobolus lusitaniae]